MRQMNVREVPDDVYAGLAQAAKANRQSLSSFVVDRLTEIAHTARLAEYLASYSPPHGTGVSLEDVVAAVRDVRQPS